jgi:hypothetical protein
MVQEKRSGEKIMRKIDRRSFLATGLATWGIKAWGAPATGARLTLRPGHVLNDIPLDYSGFSVETNQFADPSFFAPANRSLVALCRRLSAHGVLRIGGNSSEFCWWKAGPDAQPPHVKAAGQGRADNWMPQHFTAITPQAVDNLRGFLDACGWHCIWGLNFGTGTPARDAEEAAYVAKALGSRLLFFQIGNEPDLYESSHNRLRPAGWGFSNYLDEWTGIADAVTARVPDARFSGPDVANASDWVVRFAQQAPSRVGARLVGLSGHYYAEGPPESPDATIANLLKTDPRIARRMDAIMPAAHAAGLNFRMTECNSCYRGGKPGMSDAFASSLWGGDFMLDMAARGGKGINFHGGPGGRISAGLGGKLPGARNAADLALARLGTFYSPFAGDLNVGFSARPIFYGLMLGQQFAGTRLIANRFDTRGVDATAYSAQAMDGIRIAVFNKDSTRDLDIAIDLAGLKGAGAKAWRLTGPALDATKGVMLAGAAIADGSADWQARQEEHIPVRDGALSLSVPHASAALLFVA